jgi:phosphotriesterase-related protein
MSSDDERVMTVLGPVSAAELGPTLTHEHLLVDLNCWWSAPKEATLLGLANAHVDIQNLGILRRNCFLIRENIVLTELDLAVDEILEFRKLGGGTIVEVTLPDIGRDPVALQMAARMSGLNIVSGCGHYVHRAHPATLNDEPIGAIADRLIGELTDGIGTTGVRPGVIGEIGTSDPVHPREEKVLRAAVRAQQATGIAITVHLDAWSRNGNEVLRILEDEGAQLDHVVLGHLDATLGHLDIGFPEAIEYHRALAERGCFIQYDQCGTEIYLPFVSDRSDRAACWLPSDRERAEGVARLFEAGYGKQILISHDVCQKMDLTRYGGFGYGHILRTFVQNLRDYGLGSSEIDQILVENPRRMLVPAS